MPAQIGSLFASLTLESNPFIQGMAQVERTTSTTMASVRRQAGLTERAVSGVQKSFSQPIRPYSLIAASQAFDQVSSRAGLLRGALIAVTAGFGGFTAALTSNIILRYADTFTALENQLRTTSHSVAELKAEFAALEDVSTRSRSGLQATTTLFTRLQKAAPDLDPSQILRYVETIQKALQLGGATTAEATSAAIQFSQAVASNRLGGDELRAILETPLGTQLAKGLGISIGEMRKLGTEGKLTSDVILGALDKIAGSVDKQFAGTTRTLDQAITQADNKFIAYIGSVNNAYGITRIMGDAIVGLSNNLDGLGSVAGTVAPILASVFAGKLINSTAGNFARKLTAGFSEISQSSKSNLAAAKSDVEKLGSAFESTERRLSRLNALASGGPRKSFADTSDIKAVERERFQLAKLDQQQLATNEKMVAARNNLAAVTASTSPRMIAATNAISASEAKLNALLIEEAALRKAIKSSDTRLLGASGLQSQSSVEISQARAAGQERLRIEREIAQTRKQLAAQNEVLSQKQINLSALEGAAQQKAAQARVLALQEVNTLTRQSIALDTQRAALSSKTTGLAAERDAIAVRNLGKEISTTSLRSTELAGRLAAAEGAVVKMARAASPLGTALSGIKTAGLGLIGFLGGPWGAAFAVAAGALIYLGEKSSSSAQEVAAAEEVITRRLGKMAESSKEAKRAFEDLKLDAGIKAAQGDIDVSANQISKITDNVIAYAAAIDVFRQQRGDFVDNPRAPLAVPFTADLIDKIKEGTLSTEEATKAAKAFFEQQLVDPSQTQELLAEIAQTENFSAALRDAAAEKKKLADIRFSDGQKLPVGDIEQSFRKNQANNTQAQEIIGAIQQQKSEQQKIADEIKKSLEGAGIEVSPAIQKMIDAQAKATTLLQGLDKAVSDSKSILDNTTSQITTFAGVAVSKTSNIAAQLAQLRQISDQIKVDKDALAAAQSELKNTPDLTQAAFGKFDPANLKAVNDEIARTRTEIAQLAKDFEAGKISGTDLFTAIDGIAERLRALGGEGNSLDPFINGIYKALAAIPQLKSALDALGSKFKQTKQKESGLGDFIGQDAASQQYKNSKGVVSRVVNTPDGPITIHNTTSFGEGGFTSEDFNVPGGVVRRTQPSGGGSKSPVPGVDKATQQSLNDAAKALDAVTGSLGSASDKAPVFRKTLEDMGVAADTSATQTGKLNDKLVAVSSPSNNISPFITSVDEANNKIPVLLSELDQLIAKFNAVSNAKSNALSGDASSGTSTSSDSSPSQSEKFATGGIFNVGGSGGVDSQLVQFMASPDETVAIYTPAQMSKLNAALGGSSEGGGSVYHISQTIVASDVQSYKNSAAQVRSDFTSMIRATTRAAPV